MAKPDWPICSRCLQPAPMGRLYRGLGRWRGCYLCTTCENYLDKADGWKRKLYIRRGLRDVLGLDKEGSK